MNKPDRTVITQTVRLAMGIAVLLVLMLIVYAILGRLTLPVFLGGLYASVLGVANFFLMGMRVQRITERAAEKQRTEQEIAELSQQMKNRMRLSYNARMIALFALLALGIAVLHFDALATIIAAAFPVVIIRILQVVEARKAPDAKGSEEP